VDAARIKASMNKAVGKGASDFMASCMKAATTADAKKTCFTKAKAEITRLSGATKDDSDEKVRAKLKKSARSSAASIVADCMTNAATAAAKKACLSPTGAAMKDLKDKSGATAVTTTQLRADLAKAARSKVNEYFKICYKAATTTAAKTACRTDAEDKMKKYTGTSGTRDATKLSRDLEKGAREDASEIFKNCMEDKGMTASTTAAQRKANHKACVARSVTSFKSGVGKTTVSTTKMNMQLKKAGVQSAASLVKACYEAAADKAGKKLCADKAKTELEKRMGVAAGGISSVKARVMLAAQKSRAAGSILDACMEDDTVTDKKTCADKAAEEAKKSRW
jgi:hypothetical protein